MFDFGGVISSSPFEAFAHLEAERGLPTDFIRTVNATNHDANAWAQLERGEVDVETFGSLWSAEARALGHELDGRLVLERLAGEIRPQMVAAIRACGTAYKTACLTNNFARAEAVLSVEVADRLCALRCGPRVARAGCAQARPSLLRARLRDPRRPARRVRLPRRPRREPQAGASTRDAHHQGDRSRRGAAPSSRSCSGSRSPLDGCPVTAPQHGPLCTEGQSFRSPCANQRAEPWHSCPSNSGHACFTGPRSSLARVGDMC